MNSNKFIWKDNSDELISCDEKLKVLNENFTEIENICQNAFDDAMLMNCNETDFKQKIIEMINDLKFSFKK